jgi:phosphatidylglycerol:prolipoprotein diacylglycerol transferase
MFPKLIDTGSFYLPTYGLLVALGFLAGLYVTTRLARSAGLDTEKVNNAAIYCALAGLLGAKLFMFLFDWRIYLRNPLEIFTLETLQAAGVYQGGFLAAFVAGGWLIRRYGLPLLLTMDAFAPGVAVGQAIGRLGCLAAGCCWGAQCDRPWAITFTNPEANRLTGVPLGIPLHPAQIYESIANVAIAVVLYRLFLRRPPAGTVIAWYLIAYSAVRFLIEFFRFHAQELPFGGPFSNTQWIALAMAGGGVWILARYRKPLEAPNHG